MMTLDSILMGSPWGASSVHEGPLTFYRIEVQSQAPQEFGGVRLKLYMVT